MTDGSGANESALAEAERELGVRFPADYRSFLLDSDGYLVDSESVYLELWPLKDVLEVANSNAYGLPEALRGLLLIGSDGGGELLGLDLRGAADRVVLVNAISASCDGASPQPGPFARFLHYVSSGGELAIGS